MPKYFTKSAFTMSLECPRRLYYAYDKDTYANQDVDDEFLRSLAEGGFQVGEFAKLCYGIRAANYAEQQDPEFMLGGGFVKHVEIMSNDYCNHIKTDCVIGSKCFACPFHRKTDDSSDKHDGYCECWIEKAGFDPSATTRPLIKEMSGQYIGTKRDDYIKEKKYFMEDLTDADLKRHSDNLMRVSIIMKESGSISEFLPEMRMY